MSIVRSITLALTAPVLGLTASLATAQELVRYDAHQVVRAEVDTLRELRTLLALGGDVWSESIGLGSIDVMLPLDRIGTLARTGIEFEVMIPDVQRLIDEERSRIDRDGIAGVGFFEEYHQQDELFAFYEALEASRPDLVTSPASASPSRVGRSAPTRFPVPRIRRAFPPSTSWPAPMPGSGSVPRRSRISPTRW
jgi:hypothetical protein